MSRAVTTVAKSAVRPVVPTAVPPEPAAAGSAGWEAEPAAAGQADSAAAAGRPGAAAAAGAGGTCWGCCAGACAGALGRCLLRGGTAVAAGRGGGCEGAAPPEASPRELSSRSCCSRYDFSRVRYSRSKERSSSTCFSRAERSPARLRHRRPDAGPGPHARRSRPCYGRWPASCLLQNARMRRRRRLFARQRPARGRPVRPPMRVRHRPRHHRREAAAGGGTSRGPGRQLGPQRIVLSVQSIQLAGHLVEEGIDLVLVVAFVALLRRLEHDALDVFGSQRHLLSSGLQVTQNTSVT